MGGNAVDPSVGVWTTDQWLELARMFYFEYTSSRMIHCTRNRAIVEYTASNWGIVETGQSLMGSTPKEFRFFVHVTTDDQGKLVESEMHMTPQPSGFLFTLPSGARQRHASGRE